MDTSELFNVFVPQPSPSFRHQLVALRVLQGVTASLLISHLVLRFFEGQLLPFRLRATRTGTLLCPQAGVLLSISSFVKSLFAQFQLHSLHRVYLDRSLPWLRAMPVLSNWNYVFLATGGWCVCWSTLIAAILPKADKAPRAWLLNLAFFAVPIVFLGTVGSLYGLSEVNIIRAVNAGERALKTGDLRGLQSLASGMEDGLQYLKKANSVYSAFCWSMLLIYTPCALSHIRALRHQIRYVAQPGQVEIYTGASNRAGAQDSSQGQQTMAKRAEVSSLVLKMRSLLVEMIVFLIALSIYAVIVTWHAAHAQTIHRDGHQVAVLYGLLHLTFIILGSFISAGASFRLVARPGSFRSVVRDITTGPAAEGSGGVVALGPLAAREEEKRAQRKANDYGKWPSRPTTRDGEDDSGFGASSPGSRDGHGLLEVRLGRSISLKQSR